MQALQGASSEDKKAFLVEHGAIDATASLDEVAAAWNKYADDLQKQEKELRKDYYNTADTIEELIQLGRERGEVFTSESEAYIKVLGKELKALGVSQVAFNSYVESILDSAEG
jgi:hypothetical protein